MPLVANNKSAAEANVKALRDAVMNGTALPIGTVFVAGTATLPPVYSNGLLLTKRGGGISVDANKAGQMATRIEQLGKGPILRVGGGGLHSRGAVELIGDTESAAIEVEGRREPPTGRLNFDYLVVRNAAAGIRCLAGYYDERGKFVEDENHADNSKVGTLETFNVGSAFESLNQQAVNWEFGTLRVNRLPGPAEQVVLDIKRGGKVTIGNLVMCHSHVRIIKVRDYSPNNCGFTIGHLEFDCFEFPSMLSLFTYAGPMWRDADMSWVKWRVRVLDGFVSPQPYKKDAAGEVVKDANDRPVSLLDLKWIDAECKGAKRPIDTSDIKWDVRGVEAA